MSSHTIQKLCYDKFSTIEIRNKLANIVADLPQKELLGTGIFKALVSGDSVEGYVKHVQKTITFDPACKYLFSANSTPPVASEEDCYAWYRRFVFADFSKTFTLENSKPRQQLLAELTTPQELSGILNWALDGYDQLRKQGEIGNRPSVEHIKKEYVKRSDTALAYFMESVTVTDKADDYVFTDDWFRDYVTYCHKKGLKAKSQGEFTKTVKEHLAGAEKTKIRLDKNSSPLSAWRYVTFVPTVPAVPTSSDISCKIEKNSLENFLISEEKVEKGGTDGTAGTKYCYLCSKPIFESDWVTDDFTEHRPAHQRCYDDYRAQLKEDG